MSDIFNPALLQENLANLGKYTSRALESLQNKPRPSMRDDLNPAQQLKRSQNTRDYTLGLQSLVDDIGKSQSSFYQGALPGNTLPKIVSPAAGAAMGYYASSVPATFAKNPLWNVGIRAVGTLGGALIGAAGSKNATADEKKASQIGLSEFGATKPYREVLKGDTNQLGANALSNVGGLLKFPSSITDAIGEYGGQLGKGIGGDLSKSKNKLISEYGKLLTKGSEKGLQDLSQGKKQREEGINKLLNLAYNNGKLDIKKLPVDVLSELNPDFVKSIISGKNLEKFSVPDELSLAYSNAQTKKGSTEIENYFKGQGKTPEEIRKLQEVGMAGKPVASLYQSIITDPTNLIDLPMGGAKTKTEILKPNPNQTKEIKQLSGIQRELPAGIKGELPAPKVKGRTQPEVLPSSNQVFNMPAKSEENILPNTQKNINETINPQTEVISQNTIPDITSPDVIKETPSSLQVTEQTQSPVISPIQDIDNLVAQGVDLDTPEGLQKAEQELLSSGKYSEDEVYEALINYDNKTQLDSQIPTEQSPTQQDFPVQELDKSPYDVFGQEGYTSPTEEALLNNIRANRLPGFEPPMSRDFEIPMGYYQKDAKGNEKFVPLLNASGQKMMQKVPFEFGNPLEAEIFPYGADYLDFRRAKDPDFDVKNPRLANAQKTTQQIDDLYVPVARQLLAEGQDIDTLRTKLSPEGQAKMDTLLKDFTKNLYSGQSKDGNSVMTHVPNSIKKNLLLQILEKGGVAGKDPQEQAKFLRSLTAEQLKEFNLKTNSEAYKNLAPLTQRYRSQFKDLLNEEGILTPKTEGVINSPDIEAPNITSEMNDPVQTQELPKGEEKLPLDPLEQEMSSYTEDFLKQNGLIDETQDTQNLLPEPKESQLSTMGDQPTQSEGRKLKYMGKDYDVVGIQEESGLPIIEMPNKDGTKTRLPLTKNSISKTNWFDLNKASQEGKKKVTSNDPAIAGLSNIANTVAAQEIPYISHTPLTFKDKLLLNPEEQYRFGTTYEGESPALKNPLYRELAFKHEFQHGVQNLAGELPTLNYLQNTINTTQDKNLAEKAQQQLDDYLEGYYNTIGYNVQDKKQQNQLLKLYENVFKDYQDEASIPREFGANMTVLKELEPELQKLGKDVYKDPNLNYVIQNQPLLKEMVDIYLTRKDKKPLGEGNHFLDNIANYEKEVESVAGSNLNIENKQNVKPLAKFEGQNIAKLSSLQQEVTETPQFKNWFGDSKVVDEKGKPLVVHHGTDKDFNVFDYTKIGTQGRSEGAGFYFTPNKEIAEGYGKTKDYYLTIKKPLNYDSPNFSKPQIQNILKTIAEEESRLNGTTIRDGFLSNYGDVETEGLNKVLKEATNLSSADETAVDFMSSLVGSGVDIQLVNKAVNKVTGYDGIHSKGFSNQGTDPIYVAFFPEQIKLAKGNEGTFDPNNPDISKLKNQEVPQTNWNESNGYPMNYDQIKAQLKEQGYPQKDIDRLLGQSQSQTLPNKLSTIAGLVNNKQSSIIPKDFQLDLTPQEIEAYTNKPNEVQNRKYYHGASQKLDRFLDAEDTPISTARRYGNYNYTTNNPHEAKTYGNTVHDLTVDSDRAMWNMKEFLNDNPSLLKNVNTLLKNENIKGDEKVKPIVKEFQQAIERANKKGDITKFFQLLKETNPEKSKIYKDLLKNLTGLDTRIVHQSTGDWALPFSGNQIKINNVN